MKKIIYYILICIFLANSTANAHPGGHFKKGDGATLKKWELKNGEIVQGNFSFYKDDKIFLEQEDGIFESIAINNLSAKDQAFVKLKINQFGQLNNNNTLQETEPINIIYKWLPFIILLLIIAAIYFYQTTLFKKYILNSKWGLSLMFFLIFSTLIIACSKSETTNTNSTTTTPISTSLPKTSTSFIDSAFTSFKPAVSTKWDNTYFYVASSGIPNHNMMIGITNWQQQVPISQPYTDLNSWSIPLQPVYASIPLSTKTNLMKGAVAIAVNGIPIFNALNNRGEDSYLIGELDNWGGHCGKGDDYHYHAAPLHLSTTNGFKPIAFALDGFAVYGAKEADGSTMNTLDTCHGHVGTNNVYHYHGTTNYPYVVGAMKGKVTLDPATAAPENQILPQAFTKPVRPATSPLKGASISDFVAVGTNGYLLTYKIGTKNGYIKYSWDLSSKYTFTLTDTAGVAITNTYQR